MPENYAIIPDECYAIEIENNDEGPFSDEMPSDIDFRMLRNHALHSFIENLYFRQLLDLKDFLVPEAIYLAGSYLDEFEEALSKRRNAAANMIRNMQNRALMQDKIVHSMFLAGCEKKHIDDVIAKAQNDSKSCLIICDYALMHIESLIQDAIELRSYLKIIKKAQDDNDLNRYNLYRYKAVRLACECDARYRHAIESYEEAQHFDMDQAECVTRMEHIRLACGMKSNRRK